MSNPQRMSFKSDEELCIYIEEQEAILNQLDDVFSKANKKPNTREPLAESPASDKTKVSLDMPVDQSHPDNLVEVAYELTTEENEAIEKSLDEYAATYAANHGGAGFVTPAKVVAGMRAQALVDYSEELLAHVDDSPATNAVVRKALQALVKAYIIHSLPVYIFQIANVYEFDNNNREAKHWYRTFLRVQNEFVPDAIDEFWINHWGYNLPQLVKTAQTKGL